MEAPERTVYDSWKACVDANPLIKLNQRGGKCVRCGVYVEPMKGVVVRRKAASGDRSWHVAHRPVVGECAADAPVDNSGPIVHNEVVSAATISAPAAATRKRFELTEYAPLVRLDNGTHEPRRKFADGGAASTADGRKPMFVCECGAMLVWVKSARTGKSYLAECFRYATEIGERWYYVKASPHTTDKHDARIAERSAASKAHDEWMERIEYDRLTADGMPLNEVRLDYMVGVREIVLTTGRIDPLSVNRLVAEIMTKMEGLL